MSRRHLARTTNASIGVCQSPNDFSKFCIRKRFALAALVALLDPDIVLRADQAAVSAGASREVRGAMAVARQFSGRVRFAQKALVNGAVGLVWAPGGRPRAVFGFTIAGAKIVAIDLVGDPEHLRQLEVAVLGD